MATSLDADGMRIRVELIPNVNQGELVVWSYYTGKRDPATYSLLAGVVVQHVVRLGGASAVDMISDWVQGTVYLDLWREPILNADGWGNAYQQGITRPSPASNPQLPAQCAVVVTRETNDGELPVRRRRNRSYLGPILPDVIEDDGRLILTKRDALAAEYVQFDTDMATAPVAGSTPPEYVGLCNVSYKGTGTPALGGAQIAKTDQIRVGDVIDTQRSRRNGLVESYVLETL